MNRLEIGDYGRRLCYHRLCAHPNIITVDRLLHDPALRSPRTIQPSREKLLLHMRVHLGGLLALGDRPHQVVGALLGEHIVFSCLLQKWTITNYELGEGRGGGGLK